MDPLGHRGLVLIRADGSAPAGTLPGSRVWTYQWAGCIQSRRTLFSFLALRPFFALLSLLPLWIQRFGHVNDVPDVWEAPGLAEGGLSRGLMLGRSSGWEQRKSVKGTKEEKELRRDRLTASMSC